MVLGGSYQRWLCLGLNKYSSLWMFDLVLKLLTFDWLVFLAMIQLYICNPKPNKVKLLSIANLWALVIERE
jgi:hypothetical protein